MSRQNYYAHHQQRQRRRVDAELVAGLVRRERRLQPRLGTRKLHHLLKAELELCGVRIGRDRMFEELRKRDLLLEPLAAQYPIVWTDVLTPYGTAAAADSPLAVFGAMSFWWMGEHGTPRIDTSEHVWFANDQLAVRFIEEIDFDYAAPDAVATLMTAA